MSKAIFTKEQWRVADRMSESGIMVASRTVARDNVFGHVNKYANETETTRKQIQSCFGVLFPFHLTPESGLD